MIEGRAHGAQVVRVVDVCGRVFSVETLYGVSILRNVEDTIVSITDGDVEHMLGYCLGWHAVCDYKEQVSDRKRYERCEGTEHVHN